MVQLRGTKAGKQMVLFRQEEGVAEVARAKIGVGDMRTVFHKMGFGKTA